MGLFDNILKRNQELEWMYDLEMFEDISTNAYLKRMALDSCIEFISRAVAQSEFKIVDNNRSIKDSVYYKLNVKPNTDVSSDTFWQDVIYKLIYDNEVLIIVNDTRDLLVADSFQRVEFAVYDDIFKDVVVKDYKFQRSYKMSEVIYFKYNNKPVEKIVDGLFADYGDIFARMIKAQMKNYQIRGIFRVDATSVSGDQQAKFQQLSKKLFDSFSNNQVSVVPLPKGFSYDDIGGNSQGKMNIPFSELTEVRKETVAEVARAIGIPPGLIIGEVADLEKNMKVFEKFCLLPLVKKIQNELNAKLITESEYLKGKRIEVVGINKRDPLQYSEAVDKLVSSGTFTRNEVRIMLGEEPSDDKELDTFLVTKNYDKATPSTTKGGE